MWAPNDSETLGTLLGSFGKWLLQSQQTFSLYLLFQLPLLPGPTTAETIENLSAHSLFGSRWQHLTQELTIFTPGLVIIFGTTTPPKKSDY